MPDVTHLLDITATLRRMSHASDGRGGQTETAVDVATVKARRVPASQREMMAAGKLQAELTHFFYLPVGTDVRIDDLLVVGGDTYRALTSGAVPSKPIYLKVPVQQITEA